MRRAGEGVAVVGGLHNSVDTVNAAATAIVSAEARVQPPPVHRRRWGGCWSLYGCFGYQKNNKRIGHAVLVPEPGAAASTAPATEIRMLSNTIVLPFIAPPSSPASFLPSDPPSATQSPAGLLSLTSLSVSAYSPRGPPSMFATGPYAYETQLVSPPVLSTFTTEPSTAPITPPPESVHLTTPSSPEVPFAQLLTSSLERNERSNRKFPLSSSDYQHYLFYPGSPGGQLISPGSAVSNSGTSSPFPGKHPVVEIRMVEGGKLWGFEQFSNRRWGSRLGSGSLTPDGAVLSRLGSGSLTPNGAGIGSRLSSGCLTPDGVGPSSRDGSVPIGGDIKYGWPLLPAANGRKHDDVPIDPRVSFELTGEDVARALANKSATSFGKLSRCPEDPKEGTQSDECKTALDGDNSRESNPEFSAEELPANSAELERDYSFQRQRSLTLGSAKDFNFDNRNGSFSRNSSVNSEWWANKKAGGKETKTGGNSWSFFPMLQPEVS
ncbi:hypothetical protein MLD38_015675 [Melastoma candidum]|uniref:Uncharacterized protein n=1 Tax=Melastoma candidum TaxID=119954 RepID=A0ACB9RL29_9MYRT|nr:hypothetical protein MLD38_015675 [Melastoma candidum]